MTTTPRHDDLTTILSAGIASLDEPTTDESCGYCGDNDHCATECPNLDEFAEAARLYSRDD